MKNVIAAHSLPEECFVLQMDGIAKSQHRRFVDALRADCSSEVSSRNTTSKSERCKRVVNKELLCTDAVKVSRELGSRASPT